MSKGKIQTPFHWSKWKSYFNCIHIHEWLIFFYKKKKYYNAQHTVLSELCNLYDRIKLIKWFTLFPHTQEYAKSELSQ